MARLWAAPVWALPGSPCSSCVVVFEGTQDKGRDENLDSVFQKPDLLCYDVYYIKRKLYTKTILKEKKGGIRSLEKNE